MWLQWGHDFSAVEMQEMWLKMAVNIDAASMGPRLFSRGNERVQCKNLVPENCFNGATTFQPWKSGRDVVEDLSLDLLQWGHDFSAVEIATAPCSTL